ncbi:MAG: 30S ribosomal protein S4 [Holosporales bacterium]|jgi:small subunit ribosomal protein S4|nr:30S ribosomal protein S4 [Holosporales bacterium]
MTKRVHAKYKIDRRLGVNLWGRPKSPFNVRNYAPGEHGKNRSKPSDYCIQLHAKQKLKGYYGNIGEKQFRKIYQEAVRKKGDTSENLIGFLESRLDTMVYRMKFAITVFAARQLINHGHIAVNGKKVDVPSYRLNDGDEISVIGKMKDNAVTLAAIASNERDIPDYCEMDANGLKGRFIRPPRLEDVPYPVSMEPNLVIEYYSR